MKTKEETFVFKESLLDTLLSKATLLDDKKYQAEEEMLNDDLLRYENEVRKQESISLSLAEKIRIEGIVI